MMSLLTVRKRADEFATVLDSSTSDLSTGDSSAKSIELTELTELTDAVELLRSHSAQTPDRAFSATLRERLVDEAETVFAPKPNQLLLPPRPRGTRQRRLVAAASVVVLVGGSAGMAAAAQNALPGEALYPVKRGLERAQTGLTTNPASKGAHLLGQANDRLGEVQGLLRNGSSAPQTQVPQTLDDFTAQARQGASSLFDAYAADQDTSDIATVRTFAADATGRLRQLARTSPPDAKAALADAAVALHAIDERAMALCSSCASGLPALEVPSVFLAAAEVDRALSRARVAVKPLNNSHPVIAKKSDVRRSSGTPTQLPSVAPTKAPTTGVPPEKKAPSSTLSAGRTRAPTVPLTTQPVTKGLVTDDPTDPSSKLSEGVTGGVDGVDGVVETLLPDLETTKLLP